MKKHAIIPIFIPHMGCPNDCVFCNQRSITARTEAPLPCDVKRTIEEWLSTLEPSRAQGLETIEIAFYGGSFTGIPIEDQSMYLAIAKRYLDAGRIDGIHLSTRPDYINDEILTNLRSYGVKTIELGVQSFDDSVLKAANRGHDSACVYRACELIHQYGFNLGIQLMIGLPGDSLESCIFSAKEAVKLEPELARLYPTIVLDDTELLNMYNAGTYQALSREEAVKRTAEMYKILDAAGIYIMRVGLKSTDIIGDGGAINGGTYHPAFRQLVEGEIIREKIDEKLAELETMREARSNSGQPQVDQLESGSTGGMGHGQRLKVDVFSNSAWYSNMIGNSGCNREYFGRKYPMLSIKYGVDDTLANGECKVRIKYGK